MISPAPVVRPCTPADLAAVRRLLTETWHATYDPWIGPEKVREITETWHSPERLLSQVDHPGSRFLVATRDTHLAGTSFAHELTEDEIEIGRIYVHPDFQRRGIGRALLRTTLDHFPAAKVFRLQVDPRNSAAIGFYRPFGFRIVDSSPSRNLQMSGLDHLQMELSRA